MADDAPGFALSAINPAGMDINVMNAIGRELKLPVAPRPITSADREPSLKRKTATLVIHTFSITADRNDNGIDFAGPYMVTTQALLVRSDNKEIDTADSLREKTICTVNTTTGGEVTIPGAVMGKAGTIQPTTRECVDAVLQKQNDALFTDTLLLYGYMNANPGKFKIVLPGAFGQKQYYGVGLLGKQRDDCQKINTAIRKYLQTQWRTDFLSTLPLAAENFPGNNHYTGDFESEFKPTDTDMERLSCRLQ
ncbi:transporter substrate-binding domain-containing protein [Sphaerisporangium corydalis]|uniref:Transporter substrate-binding domain-containing protein n=1 Tax=Sphaerisporangium corydalis TaxID=1441875 RepID=A0ABV9EVD7_9ACTN|nr:transporter substrate-binding domain-containing protein [Sphaerisporangium corydalis]